MRRLLRDPLVHFLGAGAVLFAVLAWRSEPAEEAERRERIEIDAADVRETLEAATILSDREPTAEELRALVEPLIREEILYREALALGLDENDDEVRRRLVEKMRYLTEDLADPEPAGESELRAFFDANPERFRVPERVTFEQVFFSPRERGEAVAGDAEAALEALREGAGPEDYGDSTPLQSRFADAPREQVRVLFGAGMTESVFTAEAGRWIGPFESDFGLHLVRLVERTPPHMPELDAIRDEVRREYAAERRRQANERAYTEMRERYRVDVEWPEGLDPGDTP